MVYKVATERKVGKETPPKDCSLHSAVPPTATFAQMVGRFYDYAAARKLRRRFHFKIGELTSSTGNFLDYLYAADLAGDLTEKPLITALLDVSLASISRVKGADP